MSARVSSPRLLSQVLLLLSSVFWGASFVFTNGLFQCEPHLTTLIVVTGRLVVATLFLMPFLMLTRRLQRLTRRDFFDFLLLSLLEPFLYFICETSGVRLVPPSLSSIIISTIPLFVPFAMSLVYHDKLSLWVLLGVVLSLLGVAIMLGPADIVHGLVFTPSMARGLLYLAAAVAVGVVYVVVLAKVTRNFKPLTITAYQNLFGLIYFIPLVLLLDGDKLPMLSFSWDVVYRLLFLGVFCSAIAFVCYNQGIVALGATAATVYNNLIPVFTLLLALLLGIETFSWQRFLGMIVVIVGLTMAGRPPK